MRLENLTEQNIIHIHQLYEFFCGEGLDFQSRMQISPKQFLRYLTEEGGRIEYRVGSKWDGNSKIYFDRGQEGNVEVSFNSNFDPQEREGKDYNACEDAGEAFCLAAQRYLDTGEFQFHTPLTEKEKVPEGLKQGSLFE